MKIDSQLCENVVRFRGAVSGTDASSPLAPALSPRERENRWQYVRSTEALGLAEKRQAGLPLPGGEGRGEGEDILRPARDWTFPSMSPIFVLIPDSMMQSHHSRYPF